MCTDSTCWLLFFFLNKQHKRNCQGSLRKAHWAYVQDILEPSLETKDTKTFWKYVKTRQNENSEVAPLLDNASLITDSAEKAHILNSQFKSVFTQDTGALPDVTLTKPELPSMPDITITTKDVQALLDRLKSGKASGPDNLPNMVLKQCAAEVAPFLQALYTQSLAVGELPMDWRNANVAPVFKKGSHQCWSTSSTEV